MDKLIEKLDIYVCKKDAKVCPSIIKKTGYSISVLLKSIDNVIDLYNSVRMHPELTEDILISIIKKLNRNSTHLGRCFLITQEFCEKYKSEFTLCVSGMISNRLPVKYIIDTYGNTLNILDYLYISKYCNELEYNEYCKPLGNIKPFLENPHMTLDWYISGHGLNAINWLECIHIRPDLFTPDVIMRYKEYIGNTNGIWKEYFNKLPVDFIEQNLGITYIDLNNCISTFKNHPGVISWYVIDKYITRQIIKLECKSFHLDIPDTVNDLPRWFVKKYINIIWLKSQHANTQITYNFIAKNIALINIGYDDKIKIREQYINMLQDISSVVGKFDVNLDLYDTILEYC